MRATPLSDDDIQNLRLPPFVRVEDAAKVLGIARSTAYELTARFIATGGAAGLPAVRLGRVVRVPRSALIGRIAEQDHPSADERRTATS